MSWLLGIIGDTIPDDVVNRCTSIHGSPLHLFSKQNEYYVAAGGLASTCLASGEKSPQEKDSFWVALGCTVKKSDGACRLATTDDWSQISKHSKLLKELEGHFVFFKYEGRKLEVFTDPVGLRTLYWASTKYGTVFSSRLDWIAKFVGGGRIDYEHAGSRWLLYNQLTYDCLLRDVQRLGPSGRLTLERGILQHSHKPLMPAIHSGSPAGDPEELLRMFMKPRVAEGQYVSLGLSAGLDSRVLLSLLLKPRETNFRTHSFGNRLHPDVGIPEEIARREGFPHTTLDAAIPPLRDLLTLSQGFSTQSNLIEPISSILKLRHYQDLDPSRCLMLDGGYGEIARRRYLIALTFKGERVIRERNIGEMKRALAYRKAEIFSREVVETMEEGVTKELSTMFDTMPAIGEFGLDNYLDLWIIRTRVVNHSCDEQARLDSIVQNYMPYTQPSFIAGIFNTKAEFRKNGKLFRTIIANNYPKLAGYSLVKGTVTYPYFLPSIASWLYAKVKSTAGLGFRDTSTHEFLQMMKEFAMDALHSKAVVEYPAYNYPTISRSVNGYYSGNKTFASQVNWWLTFEMWRRNIETA